MNLEEFFDYKNRLMHDLLTNENILELLKDEANPTKSPEDFVYTQVFPYEYIPETLEYGMTFICCDVDIQQSMNKTFLLPVIHIWVFSHKSKLKLPGGGLRTDKLAAEIAKTINGSRFYGLGELNLYSAKRFAPTVDYQGKILTFHARDFNRKSPTGQQVPVNRKDY